MATSLEEVASELIDEVSEHGARWLPWIAQAIDEHKVVRFVCSTQRFRDITPLFISPPRQKIGGHQQNAVKFQSSSEF